VPRTRPELGREHKVEQILSRAELVARERGLRAVSIAEVARSLDLSANSVYWYFPSRDELWIAVVERIAGEAFESKPSDGVSWERQVLWLVDRLADVYPMVAILQDDARQSPRLAEFHVQLREQLQDMLTEAISVHVPEATDPAGDALTFVALVVGCYALDLPAPQRAGLVEEAMRRLWS